MPNDSLAQFRQQLYANLHLYNRADAIMDTVDALSCAAGVQTPAELTLLPAFHGRHYSGLYKAVAAFSLSSSQLLPLYLAYLPPCQQRRFYLFAVDTTSHLRLYAHCLAERGYIHAPNPVPGQKPVSIGHCYSLLAYLPEKSNQAPPWSPFLDVQRVGIKEDAAAVGCWQVRRLLQERLAPPEQILTVADSRYGKPAFVYPLVGEEGSNLVVRLRSNRVVYGPPPPQDSKGPGRPRQYGARFALSDPTTWPCPDVEEVWTTTTRQGRTLVVRVRLWREMRMRGKRGYPMHGCPFTLVCIVVTTPEGEAVYARPLWLALYGPLRHELSAREIHTAYSQRFDQEHGQRFLKQHLLVTRYQTPEVEHEERWWGLALPAYFQLWLARQDAHLYLRPWEKYLPQWRGCLNGAETARAPLPPTMVQRGFERIIGQIGTPAQRLKSRGNPRGRRRGTRLPPRPRRPIVRKGL